ncbi:hypothetical protein G6O67_007944 [Ophiocordyceps sinensis]|uniref:RCC1-like domain-containing protein n=1 Tax=Ophiocordyceps sinensis TaxID=72228 RepID=A0A8H4LSS6_9HYPO|nr:hypothetical protein G6O67_007944 [Ophiocordyceps sinensis]
MASKKATAKAQPGPASKADKSGAKGRSKVASKQKSPSDPPKRASGRLPNGDASTSSGKRRYGDSRPERPSKKAKPIPKRTPTAAKAEHETHPVINKVPTKVLNVLVFGNGDNGELGLGPKQKYASRPCLNPFLDPKDPTKYHITQLACGGMHTIALTIEGQLITWGVNDEFALGRNTHWSPELCDMDAVPDDEAELNPLESTPTAISAAQFPPNTRFCQVAAGDNYSIALTDTGLAYGWGTFRDSEGNSRFGYNSVDGTIIENQKTPLLIEGLMNIEQIVCGANHAMALDSSGQIFAWGSNDQLQFARRLFGRDQDCLRPRLVRMAVNSVFTFRPSSFRIRLSSEHTLFISNKGEVYATGFGSEGQLGLGSERDVEVAENVKVKELKGRAMTWAGAGGQFSIVAGPA